MNEPYLDLLKMMSFNFSYWPSVQWGRRGVFINDPGGPDLKPLDGPSYPEPIFTRESP